MTPPSALRRPVSITVWLVVSVVVLALSPVLLALGEVVARLTGDRRLAIMTRIFLAYFSRELTTLIACGAIWLLSGVGLLMRTRPVQAVHWRLLQWFVGGIASRVLETVEIRIVEEAGSEGAAAALRGSGPLLVLSRHAGPADTILLIDRLMTRFGRRPSVALKETLVIDPSIDLLAHRLPHALLDVSDPAECEARIARTVAALGPRGLMLIYPEGGNFTPERRRKALKSLWKRGQRGAAAAGEQMEHVLPPRPTGTLTALRANPSADVVFAAHTGLGLAAYPLSIWRELPVRGTLRTRMWLVPRSEVPSDDDAAAVWLNDWWSRIDSWVDASGAEG